MLYAALTGRPPFQAATPLDTLMQVCSADPVSPRLLNPAVSRDLETICLKCLEKEPERRYVSAADVAEDLRRFLADEPILARRQGPLVQGIRWVRKRRAAVALVLGVGYGRGDRARRQLLGVAVARASQTRLFVAHDQRSQPGRGIVRRQMAHRSRRVFRFRVRSRWSCPKAPIGCEFRRPES